jgi:hypothetical protein
MTRWSEVLVEPTVSGGGGMCSGEYGLRHSFWEIISHACRPMLARAFVLPSFSSSCTTSRKACDVCSSKPFRKIAQCTYIFHRTVVIYLTLKTLEDAALYHSGATCSHVEICDHKSG